jgi:transcriptional regulator with XRE-family HTH domain
MSLATQILCARTRQLALTQREFAALVGVEPVQVSRWENGKAEPRLAQVRKLAEVTGRPVSWFFDDEQVTA